MTSPRTMFATNVGNDRSPSWWLAQQVGAIVVPITWALVTSGVPTALERALPAPFGDVAQVIWWAIFVWPVGFYLALLVYKIAPSAAATGRWIWVLPSLVFAAFFFAGLRTESLSEELRSFFYPNQGEGAWPLMMLTFPACSCICYSLAMVFASSRARPR